MLKRISDEQIRLKACAVKQEQTVVEIGDVI
jgi:hypothetical protein